MPRASPPGASRPAARLASRWRCSASSETRCTVMVEGPNRTTCVRSLARRQALPFDHRCSIAALGVHGEAPRLPPSLLCCSKQHMSIVVRSVRPWSILQSVYRIYGYYVVVLTILSKRCVDTRAYGGRSRARAHRVTERTRASIRPASFLRKWAPTLSRAPAANQAHSQSQTPTHPTAALHQPHS